MGTIYHSVGSLHGNSQEHICSTHLLPGSPTLVHELNFAHQDPFSHYHFDTSRQGSLPETMQPEGPEITNGLNIWGGGKVGGRKLTYQSLDPKYSKPQLLE